jgi:beta-glucosidase
MLPLLCLAFRRLTRAKKATLSWRPAAATGWIISLPASHIAYLKKLRAEVKKPIIAVITAGSDVDIEAIAPYADAVILAWYPGEQGGNALADILFGDVSPSGHLPVTFYKSLSNLPDYKDYNMKGRTYRYYNGPVQYPFGFGMSYTHVRLPS